MKGPHCPKCGSNSEWSFYDGPQDAPNAVTCTHLDLSGLRCHYIHWYRNAPPGEPAIQPTVLMIPPLDISKKRARVRALVLAMLNGNSYFIVPSSGVPAVEQVVLFAQELDTLIESIGSAESGTPPA